MPLRSRRSTALALVALATFTDIVAYSVAVPVLPDLSRRLGASPTVVGLLFASFGLTLLAVSVPMGAVSDRVGRKAPLVGGLVALSAATLLFAVADGLPLLFAARLMQGAADAVTWVVGFALLADLYGPQERGRATGLVMSGTSFAFMIGPSFGGWLYELGGIRLPFISVAGLAAVTAAAFVWLELPATHAVREPVPLAGVLRTPAVAACASAVAIASATISMLEPVMALYLEGELAIGPARLGVLFGVAAVATTTLNPFYGRLADRHGARRLTMIGLLLTGAMLPVLGLYVELRIRADLLYSSGGGRGARHHAVARLHGGGDLGRRHRVVRRVVRAVQLRLGRRSAGRARARRLPVRADWLCKSVGGVGAGDDCRDGRAGEGTIDTPGGSTMIRGRIATSLIIAALASSPVLLTADVRTQQKSHVAFAGVLGRMVNLFGGKAAREGVTWTVALKGDRRSMTSDTKGQIVDLGEEKVYDLDLRQKTYTVTTFAQLRAQMEEARRKAEEDARKAEQENKGKEKEKPETSEPKEKEPQVDVDFDLKKTGQTKTISGFPTQEVVMTVTVREKGKTLDEAGGIVLTSDMWMAPKIAALQEIVDFDRRYARQLAGPVVAGASPQDMAAAMAMYPMMKDAMARKQAEDTQLEGTPLETTVTLDAVQSADQRAEAAKNEEEESKPSPSGGLGGMFGGLAKRMAKKKVEGGESKQPVGRATFMTMTNAVLNVTPAAASSDVAVPSDFKQK